MKIKRVQELNENLNENEIEKIVRKNFQSVNKEGVGFLETNIVNCIKELNSLLESKHGNIREVLPQMVQISNNSQITQQTAQRIVDKFEKNELMDFKRWLQLIHR